MAKARPNRAGIALLVSVVALSGLGLSFTFYTCPMQPRAAAHPCCPQAPADPPPTDTVSRTPCCTAVHVAVAPAPSDSRTARTDGPSPAALPAPAFAAIALAPPAAPVARESLLTHG